MRDAFDLFVARQLGDLFDHRGFVHLIGDFVDDNGKAVLADFFDLGFGARSPTTPLEIGFARTRTAQMIPPVGKSGAGTIFHQARSITIGLFDQRQRGIDHFAQVMRRDVGGHADRDAARAIDQHVREARGQDRGFAVFAVIVSPEIDGIFVDICQQERRGLVHADFGIAHRGRR